MPFYTTQVTIPTVDNDVANFATNRFHFEADDLTALALCHGQLQTFYNSWRPRMSDLARQNTWTIKSYDDTDPEPRAPVLETIFNLTTAPAGAPLPPEVSLCLSFQGSRQSGVPQARRRGRVYLPFITAASNDTTGRPSAAAITVAQGMGQALLTASDAAATWSWLTFSAVAPGYAQVTDGWVDNEWDTQRRRGRRYTSRSLFT